MSIIVPIYKVERYIADCLRTIEAQTFKNFECLLVDDGSPDASVEIVQTFVEKDPRFKLLRKENGGLSSARNYGIAHALGSYLMFVDSDDTIDPRYVETLWQLVTQNDADIAGCAALRVTLSEREHALNTLLAPDPAQAKCFDTEAMVRRAISDYKVSVCTKIYRRTLFEKRRFKEGIAFEDVEIALPIARQIRRAVFLNWPGYLYLKNPSGITSCRLSTQKFDRFHSFRRNEAFASRHHPDLEVLSRSLAIKTAISALVLHIRDKKLGDQAVAQLKRYLKKASGKRYQLRFSEKLKFLLLRLYYSF